ncbi:MAG: DUF697 domain-containing protein [Eggerthellaceae bacterium]|nr:DUF697 domain-containing protein [Eggerthellaceae bacterium]
MPQSASESEGIYEVPLLAEHNESEASDLDEPDKEIEQSAAVQIAEKRRSNATTIAIAACAAALVALTMLGGVLNVGDHLAAAHPALGWIFYGLIVALVVVGVVVPIVKVAKRPIFSLYQLRDEHGHAKRRRCRMLADNLIANTDLTDEEVARLEGFLQQGDEADDLLISFFEEHFIPRIDSETKRAASTAFFISAVSRSPLISTVTMLSICLDLVRSIVETCGYRPTNLGLARLYSRVMISALIIGGIEDSDLSDLLGQLMGGGAGARAGGIVIGATAEGLVSAFLVFRVGVLTKKWLTAADGPVSMAAIRRTSYREALSLMRTSEFMQTVTDTVKQTTSAVASGVAQSTANAARSTVDAAKSAFFHLIHRDEY